MEPEELPEPQDLWWSWLVLAAHHRAVADAACGFDPHRGVLHLETSEGWLRMQRVLGSRWVLWGRSAAAPGSPPDARAEAPDWAVGDAALDRRPTFLAWYAHEEWDVSAPGEDVGALHLLRPILTVDPRAVADVRRAGADTDVLARWVEGPHLLAAAELVKRAADSSQDRPDGAVRRRLLRQIHAQMHAAEEQDRMLVQRPPTVVQWSRVHGPPLPFEYAVLAGRDGLTPSPGSTKLPQMATRTLTNVLGVLRQEETSEESGAWLFARVVSDGVVVSFDRAFDRWPEWYSVHHDEQGPGLDELAWEMGQRTPRWRPAWASLLPATDED